MTDHLHPQRETYPLVNTDDELVVVFRHHIPATHEPVLYLKGLRATEYRLDFSSTLDDRAGFEVLDYTAGGTDTVGITIGGSTTTLTEATDFDAEISNEQTAINIANAINTAAIGLIATTEGGQPFVYLAADPAFSPLVKSFTLATGDAAAWTPDTLALVGALNTLGASETVGQSLLPTNPIFTVVFLKLFTGRVSVDLRSPVEVRTYFRQPARLSGNTGHPGGWPTTP